MDAVLLSFETVFFFFLNNDNRNNIIELRRVDQSHCYIGDRDYDIDKIEMMITRHDKCNVLRAS